MSTSEFPSVTIIDSRRLMGANLYSAGAGALLEVKWENDNTIEIVERWRSNVSALTSALGWPQRQVQVERTDDVGMLFTAAQYDVLMTATEVSEEAWVLAERGERVSSELVTRLRALAEAERLAPDAGAITPEIPVALVTGSNGKTTTVRLLAAMWRAAGKTSGFTCSDGVWIGPEQLESGDYSGPAGARLVLGDTRAEVAVLESARGGMLRRGLAVTHANAAIITNITADHFGEYGVQSLEQLAEVKLIVARVLREGDTLVLNARDESLLHRARESTAKLAWFSADPHVAAIERSVSAGGDVAILRSDDVCVCRRGVWHTYGSVARMPLTLGGTAAHNIENILGAVLLAESLGIPRDAIARTLDSFGASPDDNAGRLDVFELNGTRVLMDYAHNPDGIAALCRTAAVMPATKRTIILGQAGNRTDDEIRELVRAAWSVTRFDRIILKEMDTMLRGRAPGEITRILFDELLRVGVDPRRVRCAASELEAVKLAVEAASPGDVIICPTHVERAEVYGYLTGLLR